jgi:hypothetical protein
LSAENGFLRDKAILAWEVFMHEYAIEGKGREKLLFWIAFISIGLTPFINLGLNHIFTQFKDYIEIAYTVTSLTIFSFFFWVFNKFIWRISTKIFNVPELSGIWNCKGHSFNNVTKDEFLWDSTIEIKQTWNKIAIYQRTKDSDSYSVSVIGSIKIEENGEVLLSYVYENTPRSNTPELLKHKGLISLRFNKYRTKASGDYFNDQNRCTYGTMELEKQS